MGLSREFHGDDGTVPVIGAQRFSNLMKFQGFMQGLFALVGSLGRFVGPLVSTNLFDNFGYMAPMLVMAALLFLGIITAAVFRKHLVPLSLTPPVGVPTKYKNGTFYRL